jgi:hypothetical protein
MLPFAWEVLYHHEKRLFVSSGCSCTFVTFMILLRFFPLCPSVRSFVILREKMRAMRAHIGPGSIECAEPTPWCRNPRLLPFSPAPQPSPKFAEMSESPCAALLVHRQLLALCIVTSTDVTVLVQLKVRSDTVIPAPQHDPLLQNGVDRDVVGTLDGIAELFQLLVIFPGPSPGFRFRTRTQLCPDSCWAGRAQGKLIKILCNSATFGTATYSCSIRQFSFPSIKVLKESLKHLHFWVSVILNPWLSLYDLPDNSAHKCCYCRDHFLNG